MAEPHRLTSHEVAEYLGVPIETIKKWRQRNNGPPFHRNGRGVYYVQREVRHWRDVCCEYLTDTGPSIGVPRGFNQRICDGFALMDFNDDD